MVSTAARVGSINVLLSTQLGPGVAGLNAFATAVDRTGTSVARNVAGMDRSIHGLNRTMAGINARGLTGITVGALRASTALDQMRGLALAAGVAVGGLVPAALGAGMVRVVDGAHRLSNQLRTVTKDSADLKSTQDALYDVAQRTRSAFDSTVTIYARTARATEHLGLSQQKLLRITETVQKAFAIGGASSAEAQGAAIQLSQGIASDRFSGEEFRSVAENAPVLLRGMATSIGVTIGKLREMAHAGELTADVVTKAILDASKVIDEDFAKTTSTIEQAWVRVGNAVTKYAMDSKTASAGSRAIVGGLNLVTDNMAGLVEITLALGAALAATFAARRMQAVSGWVSGMKAARIETLAAAQANQTLAQAQMQAARSDFLQKRLAFNAALNQGTISAKQLERQKRALAAASVAYRTATQAATTATTQLATAQRAATAAGITMATAGRAASAVWAFMGGPLGTALLATGVAMYVQGQRAAASSEASERYAEAIKRAGEDSAGASSSIKQVAQDLFSVGAGASSAAREVSLAAARTRELVKLAELSEALLNFSTKAGFSGLNLTAELESLSEQFKQGAISAEQFSTASDAIARSRPDLAPFINDMQKAASGADAARGEIAGVEDQINKLDGKQARVTITIGTRQVVLDDLGTIGKGSRPHALDAKRRPMSDAVRKKLQGDLAEQRDEELEGLNRSGEASEFTRRLFALDPDEFGKDVKKGRAPRKTADDRFENAVQSILDRVEALRLEREMLGASFYEQTKRTEALKLEQEALRQAREEARRKGEADWQSAQISAAKRSEIERVSAALAAEADATRRATEAMDLQKDILKDIMSGMREALSDGKLEWEELGQIALRVIDKIASKIEDDLIKAIFEANSAGSQGGGGGGGIFGWIGKLFGGGLGGGQLGIAKAGGIGLYAKGTDSAPGGLAIVGEEGPELINLPRGSQVFSNPETMAILEGAQQRNRPGDMLTAVSVGAERIKDGGAPVSVMYAPIYNVEGSGPEINALRAEMARDRAELPGRIVNGVREAQKRRALRWR